MPFLARSMMRAPAWSPGDLASPSLRWSARGACELLCIAYTCPRRDGAGQITLVNYDLLLTSPLRFHSGPGASSTSGDLLVFARDKVKHFQGTARAASRLDGTTASCCFILVVSFWLDRVAFSQEDLHTLQKLRVSHPLLHCTIYEN